MVGRSQTREDALALLEQRDLEEPAVAPLHTSAIDIAQRWWRAAGGVSALGLLAVAAVYLSPSSEVRGTHGEAAFAPAASSIELFEASSCTSPQDGVNNGGNNLRETAESTSNAEDCCGRCLEASGCKGYTWVKGSSECWLKSELGSSEPDDNVISGAVVFGVAPAPAQMPSPPRGALASLGGAGGGVASSGVIGPSERTAAALPAGAPTSNLGARAASNSKARKPLAPLEPPPSRQDAGWSEASVCEGHANIGGEKSARLLGKTLRMKVDVSQIGCGCVTGVYLVEWGNGGDCDASGSFGGRCGEIDIMEANKFAWHTTLHNPDDHPGLCGGFGGLQQYDMMYGKGPRDMTGDQYGPDGSVINTNEAFHVAVSFPRSAGGGLADMVVMMHQEGKEKAIEWRVNKPRADTARSPPMTCEDAGCENCFSKPGCVYKKDDLDAFGSWLDNGMTPLSTYWGGPGNTWIDGAMDDEAGGCKMGPHGTPGTEDYGDYQGGGGCGDSWFSVGEFSLEDIEDPGMEWDEFFGLMDEEPLISQA